MEMILVKDEERSFYQYKIRVELKRQVSLFEVDAALSEREQKNKAKNRK